MKEKKGKKQSKGILLRAAGAGYMGQGALIGAARHHVYKRRPKFGTRLADIDKAIANKKGVLKAIYNSTQGAALKPSAYREMIAGAGDSGNPKLIMQGVKNMRGMAATQALASLGIGAGLYAWGHSKAKKYKKSKK